MLKDKGALIEGPKDKAVNQYGETDMNVTGNESPQPVNFRRLTPSSLNNGIDQLHTVASAPQDLDFKIFKVLPEEVGASSKEIKMQMPDGSVRIGKAVFDHHAVLSRHYSEGSITSYQAQLQSEGQRPLSKLIKENEQVVGVELSDGSRRWFDDAAFSSFKEQTQNHQDTSISGIFTTMTANGATYAEAYNQAMNSDYQDFINSKVNEYRMTAERFFSKSGI